MDDKENLGEERVAVYEFSSLEKHGFSFIDRHSKIMLEEKLSKEDIYLLHHLKFYIWSQLGFGTKILLAKPWNVEQNVSCMVITEDSPKRIHSPYEQFVIIQIKKRFMKTC